MAFTSAILGETMSGGKRMTFGTWTTDTTGGDIETGLQIVENVVLTPNYATVHAVQTALNETLPLNKGQITIVVATGTDGVWQAIGS